MRIKIFLEQDEKLPPQLAEQIDYIQRCVVPVNFAELKFNIEGCLVKSVSSTWMSNSHECELAFDSIAPTELHMEKD